MERRLDCKRQVRPPSNRGPAEQLLHLLAGGVGEVGDALRAAAARGAAEAAVEGGVQATGSGTEAPASAAATPSAAGPVHAG